MSSATSFPSKEIEKNWVNSVIVVCQTDSEIEVKPCIFRLSKDLKDTNAKAYTPQKISLGPFHCQQTRNQITHKISIFKQYLKTNNLQQILDFFKGHSKYFEPTIRSCYGTELDLDMETLLLIVIIDTIYLLHFINTYLALEEGQHEIHDHEWVRDIMMLENQIPLILIREILRNLKELYPNEKFPIGDDLFDKYYKFCSKLYPVKLADVKESMKNEFNKTHHLLHFMHQLVVGTTLLDVPKGEFSISRPHTDDSVRCALREAKKLADKTIEQIIELFETAKTAGVRTSSWLDKIESPIKAFNLNKKEPEPVDKILSVSELRNLANISFHALDVGQGFGSFKLIGERKIIYVPIMALDENTEVILRNLLAYEAAVKEVDMQAEDDVGVSEVKDHMGLMCAITKSEEDVRLLKECKVIETEMNDKDVVEIFNGLKKCMEKQHLKSKFLDVYKSNANKISDINPKVKAFFENINKWVEVFFKFLKPFFPMLVVLLLFFQSFCEMYNCRRQPLFGTPSFLSLDSQAEITPPRKVLEKTYQS